MHSRDKYIMPYYENSVKTCLDPIYQQITLTARGKLVTQGLQGLFVPSVKRGPEKLFGTRVLGLAGGIKFRLDPGVTAKKQSSAHKQKITGALKTCQGRQKVGS